VIMIVLSHGERNCGVLLQDTGARRGMALQGQQPDRRLFIWIRKVQSGRALVGSHRRCHSTVPAPHTRCGQRRRIEQGPAQPWRRALLRRSAPRRGAALGGAVGAGSFAKLHHPSSALVKKRPSFRRGHNHRTGRAARQCAAAEQCRRGRCAHGVITLWRRAAAAHAWAAAARRCSPCQGPLPPRAEALGSHSRIAGQR
jgi:hypothetical protein